MQTGLAPLLSHGFTGWGCPWLMEQTFLQPLSAKKKKKKVLSLTFLCSFAETTAILVTASNTFKHCSDLVTRLHPLKAFLFQNHDFGHKDSQRVLQQQLLTVKSVFRNNKSICMSKKGEKKKKEEGKIPWRYHKNSG